MSAGFSAAVDYFGLETEGKLKLLSSNDGATGQMAEAPDEYGDTKAIDVYGQVLAPSCEYVVVGAITFGTGTGNIGIKLGDIKSATIGGTTKKVMITQVQINTSAGGNPTISVSGVEVQSGATALRTYLLTGSIGPRHKPQDPFGALTANSQFSQINSTASVDPHITTVTGTPVYADASHCILTVQATLIDYTGTETIAVTTAANSGWQITSPVASSNPESGYIERTATLTKALSGSETNT